MDTTKVYYVTTAIAYTNALPHIGHAYEFMMGDFIARLHKILGKEVYFLTGTDEHGQKVQETAQAKDKEVEQFVDELVVEFKKICQKLDVDYDRFIRTTDKDHLEVVKDFTLKVNEKGDIYKDNYEGYYCMFDETYIPESQLLEGNLCPVCKRETKIIKEEAYFFRLSKYKEKLIEIIENETYKVNPVDKRNEILSRLKNNELKDLCITRQSKNVFWGIEFPLDPNYILYVWFDALNNYITGAKYNTKDFDKYWPCDCHIIGKDIAWFHAVIWPAMLMCVGIDVPKLLLIHGFINDKNGDKMSKSKGNVVAPLDMVEKYTSEVVRYYLFRAAPIGKDIKFNEHDLIEHYNAELADSLGNLISRAHTLVSKYLDGNYKALEEFDKLFDDNAKEKIIELIENYKIKEYIDYTFELIGKVNKYINDKQPWQLEEKEREKVIYTVVDNIRMLNILLQAFLPKSHEEIKKQLGFKNCNTINEFKAGMLIDGKIGEKAILFPKIENNLNELKVKLINGKIISVNDHPEADKLYILKVDVGYEKQLVAGLKAYYSPKELIGKNVVVVDNLKHAKLRGVLSEGMLLAVEKDNKVELLHSTDDSVGRIAIIPDFELSNKTLKIEDFMKLNLSVMDKKLCYDGQELLINEKNIVSDSIENSDQVR